MATDKSLYISTHPGLIGVNKIAQFQVPHEDAQGGGLAAFRVGELLRKNTYPIIGGGHTYDAAAWTIVTGGTGDAQAYSTAGGIVITAASDDNFDTTLTSVMGQAPASGKSIDMVARIQVSAITGIGFYVGFATGGADAALPFGTEYTDVVAINKPIASANVVGRARGNSGTAAVTGTLGAMVNNTEIEVGMHFTPHATNPEGYFTYNGVVTPMTTSQLAQVVALLTTPQTMRAVIHVTGVTATNPTLTVSAFCLQGDN